VGVDAGDEGVVAGLEGGEGVLDVLGCAAEEGGHRVAEVGEFLGGVGVEVFEDRGEDGCCDGFDGLFGHRRFPIFDVCLCVQM
jgi:hypothetical protein